MENAFATTIEPYLSTESRRGSSVLANGTRAANFFRGLRDQLPLGVHPTIDRLETFCEQRRQFALQARLHFWLHNWLWVHLPLSAALVVLMIVHVVVALSSGSCIQKRCQEPISRFPLRCASPRGNRFLTPFLTRDSTMPLRETAKQRAKRIDGRVLEGSRWLERGRFLLAGIAAIAAIGWWGAGMHFHKADAWVSPGPVAAVHATWANDCNACHTDYQAIRDDALLTSSAARSAADQKCQKCHPVAHQNDPLGPFGHHALTGNDFQLGCTTCHHEHRGTSQSLVRTADSNCTMCHARDDLAKLAKGPPAVADLKLVTQFSATGHPYFRSLGDPELGPASPKPVPRKLKFAQFSHHLHMTPGMAQDGDHQAVWTLGQIAEADRPRYARTGQSLSEPVQLDCGSCHQSESRGIERSKIEGGCPTQRRPARLPAIICCLSRMRINAGRVIR